MGRSLKSFAIGGNAVGIVCKLEETVVLAVGNGGSTTAVSKVAIWVPVLIREELLFVLYDCIVRTDVALLEIGSFETLRLCP